MSQHDLTIANQGFPAFRADLNDALQALGSCQSGTSAPSPTFANQLWYDTTNNILKIRNEDNDAWISIATLDQTADSVSVLSAATVNAGALNATGNTVLGDASTDTLNVGNGGLVKDASGNVGVGTASPSAPLQIVRNWVSGYGQLALQTTSSSSLAGMNFYDTATRGAGIYQNYSSVNELEINNILAAPIVFSTNNTERMRIKSNGAVQASKNGVYKSWVSNENSHQFRIQDASQVVLTADANNSVFDSAVIRALCDRSNNSAYTFMTCTSGDLSDDEFKLRGDGQGYADGSWNAGGADYAEYFEWADGNPNNEDRRGYSVSLVDNKIKIAEKDEVIIGVISGNPSVVGDSAWNRWTEKYLRDDFGTYLREPCEVWSWKDDEGIDHSYEFDKVPNEIIVPKNKTVVLQDRQILNPLYDPTIEYTSRENRKEWGCVGLMGKLRIRKNQLTNPSWIKMRNISLTVDEWLIK